MISYTRELWQPRERTTSSLVVSLVLIAAFACLTAVAARASIPLEPFSPVPITLQTLAVLLSGALLGSRAGASSQLVYIAGGVAGLPIGAGGNSGIPWLTGPTGGYAIGFVAAAFVTGSDGRARLGRRASGGWPSRWFRKPGDLRTGSCTPWSVLGRRGPGGHRRRRAPVSHRRCAQDRRRRRRGPLG